MASPHSNTPSSIPKQGIFSTTTIPGSSRRPSTSSITGYSPQGIGYSPSTPASPATSGIPSFRSLRSLLPFGPNKNATLVSVSVSPNPSSRSPFAGFGSVRRSMTKERERNVSLSIDASVPVIAIERSNGDPFPDDTVIRRSVSLSTLDKPLPSEPTTPFESDFLLSAFPLRTPSPCPLLSAELSTIIEADNSGVSKHVTTNLSHPATRTKSVQEHSGSTPECDVDASALDLSTTHLADQVRDAIREGDSLKKQWLNADKAVIIIDGDEHPDTIDTTFNMDTVDRDLAALLSPHSATTKETPVQTTSSVPNKGLPSPTTPNSPASPASRLPRARQTSSFLPRLRSSNSPSVPPSNPQFPVQAPSPITPKTSPFIMVNGNNHIAPKSPASPALPSASTSTPVTSRQTITLNHTTRLFSPSTTSSFSTPKAIKAFGKQPLTNGSATPNVATRTLRQVMLGVRTNEGATPPMAPSRPTVTLGRTSLDSHSSALLPTENNSPIGLSHRPSLEMMRRGTSFDSRTRPSFYRSSTSPERTETTAPTETNSSPSPDDIIPFEEYRPSLDSNTTTRPSFDGISRPNSAARLRDWDGQRTPSLRVVDTTTVRDRASPVPRIPNPLARMRKRSMSVQERFGRGRIAAGNEIGAGLTRPGSSLSGYGGGGSRSGRGSGAVESSGNESGGGVSGPKMEWLGPRTAKAFRAAGLLDFEREKEREEGSEPAERLLRDHSSTNSGVLSPSPLGIGNPGSTLNRFASLRSASEYNPIFGRSHSRLALSEAGTGGSGVPGRRGSGSFSAYGGTSSYAGNGGNGGGGGSSSYGHNGLMESPTFTVSSGSRERDTPKSSISTAPTSLADSFGYLGRDRDRSERDLNRDRERDREREEMREMKEKHGVEMGALLGALSDSQRTVRVLREENSDLRDRLERLTLAVQVTEELRQACGDMQNECGNLTRENTDLRRELVGLRAALKSSSSSTHSWSVGGGGGSSGLRTPIPKTAGGSPLARTFTPRAAEEEEEEYDATFIDHGSKVEDDNHPYYSSSNNDPGYDERGTAAASSEIILPSSLSSSTPSQKKRLSNSSSIFPIPPSNMTLLLHEDATSTLDSLTGGNRSNSADHSQYGFSLSPITATTSPNSSTSTSTQRKTHVRSLSQSPPISYQSFAGNVPNTSVGSISPTTANFSMMTGSPGSLFLRPEHEILLGDMESLDLGVQGGDGEVIDGNVDGW
ncbi:hypothetical protein BYT27DRAFT_7335330 [Phlegmacium glaucopus]|nr:hypothetical protein BYT27DRAFT_7335330 [Phlegmacium glaucopus]